MNWGLNPQDWIAAFCVFALCGAIFSLIAASMARSLVSASLLFLSTLIWTAAVCALLGHVASAMLMVIALAGLGGLALFSSLGLSPSIAPARNARTVLVGILLALTSAALWVFFFVFGFDPLPVAPTAGTSRVEQVPTIFDENLAILLSAILILCATLSTRAGLSEANRSLQISTGSDKTNRAATRQD